MSSSFFMSLERNFSLKLARVTSPGYFRSSKFSSDTSWSSASEEAKEWAAGSDCKRPAGRCVNQLAGAFQNRVHGSVFWSLLSYARRSKTYPQDAGSSTQRG